jgi:hypothetical protein
MVGTVVLTVVLMVVPMIPRLSLRLIIVMPSVLRPEHRWRSYCSCTREHNRRGYRGR